MHKTGTEATAAARARTECLQSPPAVSGKFPRYFLPAVFVNSIPRLGRHKAQAGAGVYRKKMTTLVHCGLILSIFTRGISVDGNFCMATLKQSTHPSHMFNFCKSHLICAQDLRSHGDVNRHLFSVRLVYMTTQTHTEPEPCGPCGLMPYKPSDFRHHRSLAETHTTILFLKQMRDILLQQGN